MERAGINARTLEQPDVENTYRQALAMAMPGDRVVVCGSFYAVAQAMACPV
jgi:folylpolyglutamate synthase/dihydropteroate synthase